MDKSDENRHVGRTINVATTGLEIPSELAYLMDKAMDVAPMHTERNWITAVGRVPTFPSVKNNLPKDIDSYVLPKFFKDHGIDFRLGFKTEPLEEPIVPKTIADLTKKSLEAFKLIIRFTFDDTLTQTQEYLLGSYIVHLAMQNLEMREEIYLQVMNQCINYNDEVGLKKLWLLMANLLSACKPGDRVENYVIKFVSDYGILGCNTLCQMKILSARPQCRLFPPCSLEWKSNTKSARVALPVQFLDGQTIVLDVDSFTIAEDLARHALTIKADSVHGLKGWSVALQFDNEIYEMGGHGYVLDPLSCAELRIEWNKIGGSTGSMFFLISKDVNRTSSDDSRSSKADAQVDGQVLKPGVHPTTLLSIESPRENMRSMEVDSWLDDVFGQALTSDRSTDSKKVSGWIHGLGDQMPIPTMPYLQGGIGVPMVGATAVPQAMPNLSALVGVPDPNALVQAQATAQLQTAIQQAQLQNTLLQHNVQREMLVSQLNQLQTANNQQLQRSQVQLQQTMASPPILQMPGTGQQSQQSVISQPNLSTPPNLSKTQTQHISDNSTSVPKADEAVEIEAASSPPVFDDEQEVKEEAPVTVDASVRSLSSRETISPEPGRVSPARLQSQSDEVLKNRAKTIRVGRVSWPPPPKNGSTQDKRPEPKRLPIERDPEILKKSYQSKETTTKVQRTPAPVPISIPVKEQSAYKPTSTTTAPKSSTSVSNFKASDPKSPPPVSSSNSILLTKRDSVILMNQVTERNVTPPSSAPAVILTEEDFSNDRTPSRARAEEVPHVDVAVRARQLANQLFLGNSEFVETASNGNSDSWLGHHKTVLLEAGPDTRHYMYTMVPWKLMVRKEIFSPGERMESPMLLDLLFSQIVNDTLKQPCIRLSAEEKRKIKTLIDNHNINLDLSDLKRQSNMVKKTFIDAAKAARFYFGRFYAAEWHNPNSNFYPVHWVVVNHAGVHLVHHQEDDELQSLKTLQFQEILTVSKVDSRMLSLSTRDNDRYDLICHMVGSLKSLIEMYMEEADRTPKGVSSLVRRNSSIEQLKNRSSNEVPKRINTEVIVENGGAVNHLQQQSDAGYDDIVEYGMQNFRVRDSRSKVDELLRWGKAPLQTSLHSFESAEDDRLSVEAYLAILTFMHDYPMERETNIVDYALVLLEIPMRRKNLVDEIYCLLVKQTRAVDEEHPVRENLASCWRLLSLFSMFFDCSYKLRPHLKKYLQDMMNKEEFEGVAGTTLKNLEQSQKYGGRKLLPLRSELDAEINGYSAKRIQLAMPRGLKAAVQLTPISVIDEIVDELCSSLGVTDELERSEFTIFTVLTKENISSPLRGEQYAFDVITDITMTGRPFHFFFCRTSWVADLQLRKRSGELIDLFYKQVMDDYLSGSWLLFPIGEGVTHQAKDISRLTAIQQKINNALATTITSKELKAIIPNGLARFQPVRDHEWLSKAKAELRQLLRYTSTECKADALEILSGWFLFGSMCFHVQTGTQSIIPNQNIILCLCRSGLVLLEKGSHKFLLNIPFSEVFSYEVTIDPNGPTQLDLKVSNDRAIRCFSNQANKIVHVLNQYMKLSGGA